MGKNKKPHVPGHGQQSNQPQVPGETDEWKDDTEEETEEENWDETIVTDEPIPPGPKTVSKSEPQAPAKTTGVAPKPVTVDGKSVTKVPGKLRKLIDNG